ncbi:MAG: YkgJ family cysteine cluster protein [Proteobacteria bacterium]|nr:YkgJ family cysteine cluster protein [Pseudomonadota bacterium]
MSTDVPMSDEERLEAAQEAPRPHFEPEVELRVFAGVRSQAPDPVKPVALKPTDKFAFRCHRGVSCWNACCHGADVTLTPYDILRLCSHFGVRPAEFLERYTVPALHDTTDMPVVKLKMGGEDGKGPCSFMVAEGCSVYADRPLTCRYYPLGLVSHKLKDSEKKEDFHFLVNEAHCKGHLESQTQTVEDFRSEQGVAEYEAINRGWVDILMKLASWKSIGGPMGKAASDQARQMFFMVSTDVDRFRRFVFETRFLELYEIAPEAVEQIKTDDEALVRLGFDWLKNVLFNEPTILMRQEVLQTAIAHARAGVGGA